jgi:hypothetical protein
MLHQNLELGEEERDNELECHQLITYFFFTISSFSRFLDLNVIFLFLVSMQSQGVQVPHFM